MFFSVSYHIQVIQFFCLILHMFRFSHHIPGSPICVSPCSRFSGFRALSKSYSWHFSFLMFFSVFLPTFSVLQCVFLIFTFLSVFLPIFSVFFFIFSPYSMSYIVHFSLFTFFRFLSIFHILQCAFLFFHVFHIFSTNARSYSVLFLFSTFLSFSHHVRGHTYTVHFSFFTFFTFFLMFQIIQCSFLILHVF